MRLEKLLCSALCALIGYAPLARAQQFQRVYPLHPNEGVFAYARISPDGQLLVYASEVKDPANTQALVRMETVVDLAHQQILFSEPGIDAYWSPDGQRMIYEDLTDGHPGVSIRDQASGAITRNVAPARLGDYFSWGVRDGKQLILTINSYYYYLDGDKAVSPATSVPACEGIGVGERPLLSKDGRQITTFVRGTIVVRHLTDCAYTLDTGMHGAKADFSWDGRYIAFHAPKANGNGYEIDVVDLQERTIRTVTNLPGSSLFPSWTRDGRLCFRYDGADYRGFLMASEVLSAPARPLPAMPEHVPSERSWSDVFPETAWPMHRLNLVLVWGTWSAHSPDALIDLQRAGAYFTQQSLDVGVMMATDPGSQPEDITRLLTAHQIDLPRIPLAAGRLSLTEADNQIPTTLLFVNGRLIDRRLGAQSFEQLREWVSANEGKKP